MQIQILGTGCGKCKALLEIASKAVQETGVAGTVEKIEDIEQIMAYQILMTPGLVINGQVMAAGRIPSLDEVKRLVLSAKAA